MNRMASAGLAVAAGMIVAAGYLGAREQARSEWAGEAGLTRAGADEILHAHNDWRLKVGVPPLAWSGDLARRSQERAARLASRGCRLGHERLPRGIGENLFAMHPDGDGSLEASFLVTPRDVVDAWGGEEGHYDHARNRCARGKQCGHYTQLVWRGTREVGCGMAPCGSGGEVWVCSYRPNGNIEGQRPF